MAIPRLVTKILTLPLSIAGRLLGAATGRHASAEPTTAPPTDVSTDAPDANPVKPPAAQKPAAKKPATKKQPTAPKLSKPEVTEPMTSVTDIDADAHAEDVDVTPSDVAKAMGSQLDASSDTTTS